MKEIFVFGSNLAGRHGKGGALTAMKDHGAIYGKGRGLQGNSYAIPTKDFIMQVLPLYSGYNPDIPEKRVNGKNSISEFIKEFLEFAHQNPDMQFNVTKIGCGLAGYDWEKDIFPIFKLNDLAIYRNVNFI